MKKIFLVRILLGFVFFSFPFSPVFSQRIITTICGNDTCGYKGDGGKAINATICPEDVIVDGGGNIYISDPVNNVIRKIDAHSGTISTIAGTGVPGFSGDGGPATSAQLYEPTYLAVDNRGNIYIADAGNNRIRKIDDSYNITTIAGNGIGKFAGDGGKADTASFNGVNCFVVDSFGNIYIAEGPSNRIRKITKSTGIITTIAGNGTIGDSGDGGAATAANLYQPIGVCLDKENNVYIGEPSWKVRRVDAVTGVITSYAGNGSGYGGDGGLADTAKFNYIHNITMDDSDNMYISDMYNNVVRKISRATGIITTVVGNGYGHGTFGGGFSGDGGRADSAELNKPRGLALDNLGNLFVVDSRNSRVRKVSPDTNSHVDVGELKNENAIVYPTITQDKVTIQLYQNTDNLDISITTVLGKKLNIPVSNISAITKRVDLSSYPAGIYILRISDAKNNHCYKIFRQ